MKLFRGTGIALSLLGLLLAGCSKKAKVDSPEATLHRYVEIAFNVKSVNDRKDLLDLSTGEAQSHIQSMTDEDFKKQFMDSKMKLVSVKTRDLRQEQSGDVSLVYELAYKDMKDNSAATHTNKKIAYLTRVEGESWKIRATKNIKSFIERKEDLVITPETTNKEGEPAK